MPTRKQRRRRAKELRHEYVWEDAEGNVIEPAEHREDASPRKSRSAPARPAREPQAPSWRRTLKRGLVFAPIMFVTVMLLSGDLTLAEQVVQTLIIVAIFIPFSFLLDQVFWRSYQRRTARRAAGDGRGS